MVVNPDIISQLYSITNPANQVVPPLQKTITLKFSQGCTFKLKFLKLQGCFKDILTSISFHFLKSKQQIFRNLTLLKSVRELMFIGGASMSLNTQKRTLDCIATHVINLLLSSSYLILCKHPIILCIHLIITI